VRYEVVIDVGRDANGRRRQSPTRYRTLRCARVALAKTRVGVEEGTHVARETMTVRTYLEQWVGGKIDLRSSTREGYRTDLKPVVARFGDLPLQKLTKAHLDRLVAAQSSSGGRSGTGRSARTVTLMLVVLGQALEAAGRQRLVTVSVASLVNRPAPAAVVPKQAWTAEQVRTFLAFVAAHRLACAWRLSMLGLRRGEVLGLKWSEADLEAGSASVMRARVLDGGQVVVNKPKTARGTRTVYLPAEVVADLRRLKTCKKQSDASSALDTRATTGWSSTRPDDRFGRSRTRRSFAAWPPLPVCLASAGTTLGTPQRRSSPGKGQRSGWPLLCLDTTRSCTSRPTSTRTKTPSAPRPNSSPPSIAEGSSRRMHSGHVSWSEDARRSGSLCFGRCDIGVTEATGAGWLSGVLQASDLQGLGCARRDSNPQPSDP
jgi:integrase